MKSTFIKSAAGFLALILTLTLLSACSNQQAAVVEAAPEAIPEDVSDVAATPTVVTIVADGRHFIFEDVSGGTVQQLLDQAGIILNEGDSLSIAPDQVFPDDIIIEVLRQHTVTVTVATEEGTDRHTAVLTEGTVADAIAAVGVELAQNQVVNFQLNKALTDNMEIIISGEGLAEVPTTTEPPSDSDSPTEPAPVQSGKTIISIEVYEDCDGSGHGIKVITYSDGTQEEVMF